MKKESKNGRQLRKMKSLILYRLLAVRFCFSCANYTIYIYTMRRYKLYIKHALVGSWRFHSNSRPINTRGTFARPIAVSRRVRSGFGSPNSAVAPVTTGRTVDKNIIIITSEFSLFFYKTYTYKVL